MRFDIGILTGSGPEAGLDLWRAVLDERRRRLGGAFRGDLDAPSVVARSDPRLGRSMDMERHADLVADVVLEHASALDQQCAAWAIACNTIHLVVPQVRVAGHTTHLVSFVDVVDRWITEQPAARTVALLGVRPVSSLGEMSPYAPIASRLQRLDGSVVDETHALVAAVKRFGVIEETRRRWVDLVDRVDADRVILGCTELPLLADPHDDRVVDVTRLVAAALVDEASTGCDD